MNTGDRLRKLEVVESKFRFVHVASRRARQIMGGARPAVESESRKPARLAEEEVLCGLVPYEVLPPAEAAVVSEPPKE